ncbi:MOSC domain-containing protein [Actinokineospora sp. NBRC 105648]|uniref:MOSC domain-containing protein n=1 Tax=Actinokineospora sp. NBRC 105648 TaxID=3032206 RepID=UPI0024A32F62|nr:MOSC domain-containing protein [Actinokineospora sp. NBRC 105648]GLZ39581.1 molybdenum cofactor sulfurase [Actinokineospora sp. NBRC 105648]
MNTVHTLARYPVKSLRGEELAVVELDERGVVDDRRWALLAENGKFGSGKSTRRFTRMPRLLEMWAKGIWGVHTVVGLPDGREYATTDDKVHDAVSEVVGQPVTVVEEAEIPHLDAGPLHIVTTASLRWLGAEWQRARPNIVVDVEGADRPEDDWVGRRVSVGTAELEITGQVTRCAMLEQAQGDLPRADLLPALVPYDLAFGVYARVVRPGVIGTGDQVRF